MTIFLDEEFTRSCLTMLGLFPQLSAIQGKKGKEMTRFCRMLMSKLKEAKWSYFGCRKVVMNLTL